jgi:uncharacterized caspase-like protein
MDIVAQVRERLNPEMGADEVKELLERLKIVTTKIDPTYGDAWYYRYLCEKMLGNREDAAYALRKAKQYGYSVPDDIIGESPTGPANLPPVVRDKWALVVGINQFNDRRINPLQYTAKDAKDFAAVLTSRDVGRFPPDHVRVLTNEQATTKAIKENLNWLARSAKEDDLVVIHLSSHGSPREMDTAGVSYVVTYDTDVSTQDTLYATALPMVDLADAVRFRIKAQRVVIFLDTCFSGAAIPGAKVLVGVSQDSIGVSPDKLNLIRQGVGRVVIASSQANERSWESDSLKNGYFTYYLIEGLKQNKGLISIEKLYEYVRDKVSQQVRKEKGASQTPVMSKSQYVGEIYIGVNPQRAEAKALFRDPVRASSLQANERRKRTSLERRKVGAYFVSGKRGALILKVNCGTRDGFIGTGPASFIFTTGG